MAKKSAAKSVAKNSGTNDFDKDANGINAKRTVTGPGHSVPTSGQPDFVKDTMSGKNSNKTVSTGGAPDLSKAYATIRKAQEGPSSDF